MTTKGFSLQPPEETVKKLWDKIPLYIKITFFTACASGLLAHLYVFTKKLLNHDDIGALFQSDYGTASGRWLLPFLSNLDGNFSTPWLLGTLSILIIALAACFVVSVLRIRRPLACMLAAAVMVSYPTVTATMVYMFSADAYFLSLALACFAAYVTSRFRFGFIPGALAIMFSMGIYQSYFGVAAVLMVGALLLDTLDGKTSLKELILKGVKFVATLGAGMVLYMVVVKITTLSNGLVDYMGLSEMGKISLSELPKLISHAYLEYGRFFLLNDPATHFYFMKNVFVLAALSAVVLCVCIVRKQKLKAAHIVLLSALALVYPLAGNIIYVMVPKAPVHMLMLYGMVGVLLAPLVLAEYYQSLPKEADGQRSRSESLCALCSWIVALALGLSAYGYTVYSNEIYLKMELSYEQTDSFSTRLLGAIEAMDGYAANTPVILIGRTLDDVAYPPTPELDSVTASGVANMSELINSYTYGYYLRRFHGASNIIYDSSSIFAKQYEDAAEVRDMPSYPAAGSIKAIDNYIIVKFS